MADVTFKLSLDEATLLKRTVTRRRALIDKHMRGTDASKEPNWQNLAGELNQLESILRKLS